MTAKAPTTSPVERPAADSATDLTRATVDEILTALGVHVEVGLTPVEVEVRRRQHR